MFEMLTGGEPLSSTSALIYAAIVGALIVHRCFLAKLPSPWFGAIVPVAFVAVMAARTDLTTFPAIAATVVGLLLLVALWVSGRASRERRLNEKAAMDTTTEPSQ